MITEEDIRGLFLSAMAEDDFFSSYKLVDFLVKRIEEKGSAAYKYGDKFVILKGDEVRLALLNVRFLMEQTEAFQKVQHLV